VPTEMLGCTDGSCRHRACWARDELVVTCSTDETMTVSKAQFRNSECKFFANLRNQNGIHECKMWSVASLCQSERPCESRSGSKKRTVYATLSSGNHEDTYCSWFV